MRLVLIATSFGAVVRVNINVKLCNLNEHQTMISLDWIRLVDVKNV